MINGHKLIRGGFFFGERQRDNIGRSEGEGGVVNDMMIREHDLLFDKGIKKDRGSNVKA